MKFSSVSLQGGDTQMIGGRGNFQQTREKQIFCKQSLNGDLITTNDSVNFIKYF